MSDMTTTPTPDAGVSHADAMLCAKHIVALRAKYDGHRDTYAHGEHNLALAYLELTAQLAAAKADGAIFDRVQDNLAVMNRSGEISDAIYEKFYEVIPHQRWEQWNAARTGAR